MCSVELPTFLYNSQRHHSHECWVWITNENTNQVGNQHVIWTSIKIWGGWGRWEIKKKHVWSWMEELWALEQQDEINGKNQSKMNRFDWGRLESRWKGPGEGKTLAANVRNIGTTKRISSTERAGTEKGIGSQCPLEQRADPSLPSTPKPVLTNSTAPRKQIPEHPAGTTGLPVSSDAGSCTVGSHSTASEHSSTNKETFLSQFVSSETDIRKKIIRMRNRTVNEVWLLQLSICLILFTIKIEWCFPNVACTEIKQKWIKY